MSLSASSDLPSAIMADACWVGVRGLACSCPAAACGPANAGVADNNKAARGTRTNNEPPNCIVVRYETLPPASRHDARRLTDLTGAIAHPGGGYRDRAR